MSEIRANTVSNAAGTGPATLTGQYAAKAWVNWQGTGTVTIRESANISSITDHGAGDFTVNLTSALADANYSVQFTGAFYSGVDARLIHVINDDIAQTSSTVRTRSVDSSAGNRDSSRLFALFTR